MAQAKTSAIHAGRENLHATPRPHVPQIDLSSTYPLDDLEGAATSLNALAHGAQHADSPVYARLSNPTVDGFETALATLEKADEAVAFASGMGAVTACLLAARLRGANHIVAARPIYGGTDHLLASGLTGLEVSFTSADPEAIRAALREDTGLVLLETPANPTLALANIAQVVEAAGDTPVLVDNTFATPMLQNPIALGAALVLHSATKFLGGHGDAVGGIVAGSSEWCATLRQVRIATGAILHPLAGYLFHRGLQTLPLRVQQAQSSAMELAQRLVEHPAVEQVYFPAFDDAWVDIKDKQMQGPGCLISFEVGAGYSAARTMMQSVKLLTPAVSLGSVDSLIQHPASLTHQIVSDEGKSQGGISDSLLRLSVGLEDIDDLWEDISQALESHSQQHWPRHAAG